MYCRVLVASKAPGIGNGLTYDAGSLDVRPGMLVRVPLRKSSAEGVVIDMLAEPDADAGYEVKTVAEILSPEPLLTVAQLRAMKWMAGYYLCSLRQAMRAFLPPNPWKQLIPRAVTVISLVDEDAEPRGDRQRLVVETLRGKEGMTLSRLREETGASLATVRALADRGVLALREERDALSVPGAYAVKGSPTLTPAQERATQEIVAAGKPSLLFGITGSGKTEVYADLIAKTAAAGGQSILLVPEILLTEHHVDRFESLLPGRVEILHSRLTPAQRRRAWQRVASGEVALVIGSRSALFAPLRRLKLVVIDEEHEWTYKNEQSPRYHARETAQALCLAAGATLVLGTATPSLDAWARVKTGQYALSRLPERFGGAALPSVRVVDLATVNFGSLYPFSPPLLEAIAKRLDAGEQSILFLNRRGLATALVCLQCRQRVVSAETALPLTLHRSHDGRPFLLDHLSGAVTDVPPTCPHCQSVNLRAVGAGTQKIEDIVAAAFPTARVLRADRDTLTHPEDIRSLLARMRDRDADILLGTQSVVKGLDLPGVTLSAVLLADVGLSLPSFRAGERVFQLLTQLTGRSGRRSPGDVIIQTFRPSAQEVHLAATHQVEQYLETEMILRASHRYPPLSQMVRLLFQGPSARADAHAVHEELRRAIARLQSDSVATLAPTLYGGGKVWHVLLRGKHPRAVLAGVELRNATVDVDPVDCL